MIKIRILLLSLSFYLLCNAGIGQLVINEFSQGASGGNKEYIELIVVGTKTCTDSTADIRGWIIDDHNGWFGTTSYSLGHIRFANVANWQAVPYGSIILLYNNADKNASISIADDPTDSNKDYVYVVPINGSTYMQEHTSQPPANSPVTFTYPTTGYVTPSVVAPGAWESRLPLNNNSGEVISIVKPGSFNFAYFSLMYGMTATAGYHTPTVTIANVGSAQNGYLSDSLFATSSSWLIGSVPANETPGVPNGGGNTTWINRMRTNTATLASFSVTPASACPGVPFSFTNLSTISPCGTPFTDLWNFNNTATSTVTGPGSPYVPATNQANKGTSVTTSFNANTRQVSTFPAGSAWPTTRAGATNTYIEFLVYATPGRKLVIDTISWSNSQFGGSGNTQISLEYGINNSSFTSIGVNALGTGTGTSNVQYALSPAISVGVGDTLKLRLYFWSLSGNSRAGVLIDNFTVKGNVDIYSTTPSYTWDFGDASTSTATNPIHSYASAGTYAVKLTASNNCNCQDDTTINVTVIAPPTPTFTVNNQTQCTSGNSFTFTNTTAGTNTYSWKFGDGATATGTPVTHVYASTGSYTVKLIATNSSGCTDSTSMTVNVNAAPAVDFTINANPQCLVGNSFVFTNNSNATTCTNISTASWPLFQSTQLGYILTGPGASSISASDAIIGNGLSNIQHNNLQGIRVRSSVQWPTNLTNNYYLDFPLMANTGFDLSLLSYSFTGETSAGGSNNTIFQWGYILNGGAPVLVGSPLVVGANQNVSFSSPLSGIGALGGQTLVMRLYIYAEGSVSASRNVYIEDVVFKASTSSNTINYIWNFGDGTPTSTTVNPPPKTYAAAGSYEVTLIATNGCNCSDSIKKTISVIPTPTAPVAPSPQTFCSSANPTIADLVATGSNLQWFAAASGGTALVTSTALVNNTIYYASRDSAGCTSGRTPVTVTLNPDVTPSVSITPTSVTSCTGSDITFTATPVNGGTLPTYQWLVNGSAVPFTGSTFTSSTLNDGDIVSVVMTTNAPCATTPTATSNAVVVTITTAAAPSVNITPATITTCTDSTITFTASPGNGGSAPTYQWYVNGNSINGATGSTFISATLSNGDVVSVVMTSNAACASTPTDTSNLVTVTINPNPPAPFLSVTDTCGSSKITANGFTGSLIWSDGGTGNPRIVTTAGTFTVTQTIDGCTSTASNAVAAAPLPFPVAPTVTVTSQPTCTVSTGTITITAPTGTGLTYSIDGVDYSNTSGTFINVNPGGYNVTVRNSDGCTSPVSSVTVNQQTPTPVAPSVSETQPSCTVATGTISITAPTGAGLTYSIDGLDYTNTSGVFPSLSPATYSVTAKNSSGCISDTTLVTINAQPPTPVAPTVTIAQPTCTVATGTINVTGPTGSGLSYSIDGVDYTNTTGVFSNLAPNTYSVTVNNNNGCISPATSVTINTSPAVITVTDSTTIYGCNSVDFGGTTYTSSTIVRDTLRTAAPFNCDSIYYVTNINIQNLTPVVKDTTIYGCNSVVFNGTNYTSSVVLRDTVRTAAPFNCDSIHYVTNIIVKSITPVVKDTTIYGCNSVVFNGTNYTNSVTLRDTVRTAAPFNCDSIQYVTNIIVKSITPVVKDTTIYGCNSVMFNGTAYTSSVTLRDTVRTAAPFNCDSIHYVTNIIVKSITPVVKDTTIYGCNSVVFNGTNYTNSVTLRDTIRTAAPFNCDSIRYVTNIIVQSITPVVKDTTIYGCNSVVFNGTNYTNSVTLRDTVRTAAPFNCDSIQYVTNIIVKSITPVVKDTTIYGCNSVVFNGTSYSSSVTLRDTVRTAAPFNCDSIRYVTNIIVKSITPVVKDTTIYGCNSVVFNGTAYTSSVTLRDTVRTAAPFNCDSIRYVTNIIVQSITPGVKDTTIYGCNSVVFNGTNYTNSVTLRDTVRTAAPFNCDSIRYVTNIIVKSISPVVKDTSIYGCNSVVFNGTSYSSSVTLRDTVRTAAPFNCDSIRYVTNIIVKSITPVVKDTTIYGCNSVVFNGTNYTTSVTLRDTVRTAAPFNCDSIRYVTNIIVKSNNPVVKDTSIYGCNSVVFNGTNYANSVTLRDTVRTAAPFNCDSIRYVTNIIVKSITPVVKDTTIYGCNSVVFNGTAYTSSVTLRDTVRTAAPFNCDSIRYVTNIIVQSITPGVKDTTIYGCNSVVFNGTNYTNSVTLRDTVRTTAPFNCDSIRYVTNIIVKSITPVVKDTTIYGCNSVIYNGITYTSSIILRDTVKSADPYSCDSVYNVANITVQNIYPVTNNTSHFGCNSVVVNGVTYTSSTIVRDTIKTSLGCDSVYNVATITVQNINPVTNNTSHFGCNSVVVNGVTYTSSTIVRDTIKTSLGCDSVYNVATITVQNINPVTNNASHFGCNSVVVNGVTYTSSTIVRDTIKTSLGCDSVYNVATINVQNITPVTNNTSHFGCNSVVVNGVTYTSSTIVRDTIKTSLGCDSVYNVATINVQNITPVTNNTSHFGCNSVVVNGVTYTSSTIVRDTIKTSLGCDSVYNVATITVQNINPVTNNTSHFGCNSVVVNGVTYTSSTIVRDTIKTSLGCDSVYNVANITVQNINPATNNTSHFGCNSVVVNGVTYTSSTVVRDTIKTSLGCDSVYNVATINVQNITPVTNNTSHFGCNSVVVNGVTYTSSTVVRDTIKTSLGCDSVYNVATITVQNINPVTNNTSHFGCNSVVVNGVTYTSSTIVRDTIKTSLGCDSVYNVATITVQNITPVTNNISHFGCNSVVVNGVTYTSSTVVRDTIKTSLGCDSVHNVATITVQNITPVTSNTSHFGCNSVVVNGVTYTSSTIVRDTIKTSVGCDSVYNVATITVQNINPVTNNASHFGCNSVVVNGVTYISSTILRDTVKTSLGCDSVYNVATITVQNINPVTNNTSYFGCNSVVVSGVTFTSSTIVRDTIKTSLGCDSVYNVATITVQNINPVTNNASHFGCNSVVVNGVTYTSSTIVRDTIKTSLGCDSVYNVATINVQNITPVTDNTSHFGCNSVVVNGVTYTSSTIVRDTIKTSLGCDSAYNVATITVQNINPVTNNTSHFGCNSVVVNGVTYTSSTIVRDTIKTSLGCDSVYNVATITVQNINPITNNTSHFGCNSVLVNGVTYTSSTIVRDTIKTSPGCDSIYNVATITIAGAAITATQNLTGCTSVLFLGVTHTSSTIVNDTLRSTEGCDSIYRSTSISVGEPALIENQAFYSCNSITFEGVTYTNSTTLTDTLVGIQGCDSVYRITNLYLQHVNPITINNEINACNIVTYNGITYTSSAIVRDTVRSSLPFKCDSIYNTLTINIKTITPQQNHNTIRGCNSVLFNGTLYTSSITISDTIKTSVPFNCDSIYNVHHLLIENITPVTTTNSIAGCDSVVVNGVTYTASTILRDTIFSSLGCDSVYNVTNINVQSLTADTIITDYFDCKSYTYNGTTYTSAVVLRDTVLSSFGCDSIYNIINITIADPAVAATNNLSGCTSVTWLGVTYTASVVVLDTLFTTSNCDSIYRTTNITIGAPADIDSISVNGCNSVVHNGTTYTTSTILRDTLVGAQGCDSLVRVTSINVQSITADTITTDYFDCKSYTYNGTTYTSSVVLRDTVLSSFGCDSIYNVINITIASPAVAVTNNLSGCSSVTWLGVTYTASAVVLDTLFTTNNCDSIYRTTNITIGAPADVDSISINGCNSVVHNGTTYTTSTILRDTLVGAQGCDSLYRITSINVQSITADTITTTFRGCNSVVVNGVTYTASTILRDTVVSVYGCDSIYNVTNIIIQPVTGDTVTTNLFGCTSVTFDGVTYTSSITLRDTVLSSFGCDSIYNIINITIAPPAVAVTNNLSGCSSVTWLGITYTASAVVLDTLLTTSNCDSIYRTTNITIGAPADVDSISINGCNSVVHNGTTYTTSTILRDTLVGAQGCDSLYRITSINVQSITADTITTTFTGCNSVVVNGVTYSASTILRDTIVSVYGCDSIYNVTNIIIQPVTGDTVTTNLFGCTSVTFNGVTYTSSITLRDTVLSSIGCDSVYNIINIRIADPAVAVTNNLSGCSSVTWLGVTYTASAVVLDTLFTTSNCDSIYRTTNITIGAPADVDSISINGCNSVIHNGTTYNTSTILRDTLVGAQGCDSLYRITSINVQSLTADTITTDYFDCKSYTYNGTTYTSSVVLRDTVLSSFGCDSIYNVINITIASPAVAVTNNLSGCSSVTWLGVTYTASAVVLDTLFTTNNCDSIYRTTNITIGAPADVDSISINGCNSVVHNGTTYTTSTILRDTLVGVQGCDSLYRITSINVQTITANTVTTSFSGCDSVVVNSVIYTASTILRDTIFSSLGCDSIYNVTNINVQSLTADTIITDYFDCKSYTYNGTTYTSSVVLRDTIFSSLGCDSIYNIINITIASPAVAVTNNLSGCTSVTWLGVTYNVSVVVLDTLFTTNNCDSIYRTTNITIGAPADVDSISINGCNTVVHNGTTYTTSTILRDTLVGAQGCDSLYRITSINVQSITADTITKSLSGCHSVLVNGVIYTGSTILRDTIFSSLGCDSVYNVTNINVQSLTADTIITDYFDCKSYTYNGVTYTSSVVLRDTVLSSFGCDSIYNVINITIASPAVAVTNNLSGCSSVTWLGITYTASAVVLDTLLTTSNCDSIYRTTNITIGAPADVDSISINGCNSVVHNGTTYTTSTILRDTLVGAQGCDSLYRITSINVQSITADTITTTFTGCNSVVVNGVTYSASTILRDTIVSVYGCDSIYNVTNIIIQPVTGDTVTTNLFGCTSVTFNGVTYTSSITLRDTVLSSIGCDSVYNIINIRIADPAVAVTNNLSGCSSVTWLGVTYTASAVVLDTLFTTSNCDSIYRTTNITIGAPADVDSISINGCNSVVHNGTTYTTSTILRDTLVGVQGCDSLYRITSINVQTITANTVTTSFSGCDSVVVNSVIYTASTILRDTIFSSLGCDSIYNVTNINVQSLTADTIITDYFDCKSYTYNGTTYTSSVVLRDTIFSSLGCDSIYNIINITIASPAVAVTNNLSGCTSVTWLGVTYNVSVVVLDTLFTTNNCDSIYRTTNITIGAPADVDSISINGCNTVVHNGTTYTTSTILRDTLVGAQGCDSLYRITSINVQSITADTITTDYFDCKSYTYNGTTYTSSVVLRDTVLSSLGCDSIYNIINITIASPAVAVPNNLSGCSSVTWLGLTYTASAVVLDTLFTTNNCDSIYRTTNITIGAPADVDSISINGCNSVVHNGTTYTTSTILRDTLVGAQGCDSLYRITSINVQSITADTITTTFTGCNSVVVNGVTYTASTILRDTVVSVYGCDSIYNVTNIIIQPVTGDTVTTNLFGCTSVTFNGLTYTSSITLRDTVLTSLGCDSIYNIINITIAPPAVAVTNNLSGCTSVTWLGITYTASAVVLDTLFTTNNCDSIYRTTNITIGAPADVDNISVNGCNSVVHNGTTYTTSTILRDTLVGAQGCDSLYRITSINVQSITADTITTTFTGCNSVVVNGVTYTGSTILRDTVVSVYGCDSIYNVTNITIAPVTGDTVTTKLFGCSSVTFNGVTYTSSTTLRDTVLSSLGCDSIYNVINITIAPPAVAVSNNLSGCSSVTWLGVTYTASAVVLDTLFTTNNCDSIYRTTNIAIGAPADVDSISVNGCNSVVHNGTTYTTSAILRDTLVGVQGCDSLYRITSINVQSVTADTITTTFTGCNSVVVNGVTYTSSTILRDTVLSVYGCDSIYNVTNITIAPVTGDTVTTNLFGCTSVTYNGTTYTSSVVLRVTVLSSLGCDSIYNIINITIADPAVAVTNNLSGCSSVTWLGTTYTVSAVVLDTLFTTNNCDSIYRTTNITIGAPADVDSISVNGCNSVLHNGTTYTTSTILRDTLVGAQGCDSLYRITSINVQSVTANTITTSFSGCASVVVNGVTYTASTILRDTIFSSLGCDSVFNVTNINVQSLSADTIITDYFDCKSYTYNGVTYTSSVVLRDTVLSSLGCDSIFNILNVTIADPAVAATNNLSGCTSVTWLGVTYTASAVVLDTLFTINNCDSIYRTTNITIGAPADVDSISINGCNSVVHNGTTYTTSTILRDTILGAQGCDSLYRITSINVQTITANTIITDYFDCKSYTYNGTTYTSSVVLRDTVLSSFGCDSIYNIINITIAAPAIAVTNNLSGCTSVTWVGLTYTASAIVLDTLFTTNNCDSIYRTTNITIGAPADVDSISVNGCNSVLHNGTTYTTSTILRDTLVGAQGCDSLYRITSINVQSVTANTITTSFSGCASVVVNGVTYTASTILRDTIFSSLGCDSVFNVTNINVQSLSADTIITDYFDCKSYTYNGVTYTSSVVLRDTVLSSLGCDSIFNILNVTIADPAVAATNNLSGCTSVTWLGVTYTASAVVLDTLFTINNCDSIYRTTNITIGAPADVDSISINGCNSVVHNGTTYTTSTILRDTILGAQGCDSLYRITSINVQTITANTIITDYFDCKSYTYNGTTYTSSVVLRDTVLSSFGCDSIYNIINITIAAPAIAVTNNLSGCSSVTWLGTTYTASAVVLDTLFTTNNCDSIYRTTNITIGAPADVDSISINGCNSVIHNGTTYTTSTILRDTLVGAQGCDSLYRITSINVQGITADTITTSFSGCDSVVVNGVTYTASTILRDTIFSSLGCDSVYNVTNITIQNITPDTITTAYFDCKSYTYNGTTYTSSVVLRDTVLSSLGCDSIYNIINIRIKGLMPVTRNVLVTGCNSVLFQGITYVATTIVRDTLKTADGCDSLYQVANIIIQNITPQIQTNSISGCNSVSYLGTTYTASTIVRDTIRSILGCDSIFRNTSVLVSSITPVLQANTIRGCNSVLFQGNVYTTSTIVRDTARSIHGCDSVYKVTTINVQSMVASTTISFLKGCTTVIFNGNVYTTSTTLRDTIRTNNTGCDSIYRIQNIEINPAPITVTNTLTACDSVDLNGKIYTASTSVSDTLKSVAGCDSVYRINNIVITPFVVDLTATPNPVTQGNMVSLLTNAATSYTSIAWTPASLFNNQSGIRQTFIADSSLTISFIARSSGGCIDTATINLTVNIVNDLFVPNVFTPNGDGQNDEFRAYSTSFRTVEMKIFNQYGEMIFESKDGKGWDGTYKSKQQPVSMYSYIISGTFTNGQSFVKKGILNLIR